MERVHIPADMCKSQIRRLYPDDNIGDDTVELEKLSLNMQSNTRKYMPEAVGEYMSRWWLVMYMVPGNCGGIQVKAVVGYV